MNEKIKELAEQAEIYVDRFHADDTKELYWIKYKEKFAELIVAECMKLNCKELSITAIERLLPLYKEHFGVEE
jgi:hypothetical protein